MRRRRHSSVVTILTAAVWLLFTAQGWGQTKPVLTLQSESAVLMDGVTRQVLFVKNAEKRFRPASLAKMMTLYLAFEAIKRGEAEFDDEVTISKKAWKMGGSQMFLEVGDKVKFVELVKGAAAVSANDGALAIAEFLSGSEEVFVHQMNERAQALGMENTRFVNPHGLPRDGQYTTANDMAILGFHYVNEHPEAVEYHALPTYTYGGIRQKNWNPLLKLDQGVDGLKTGYLKASGYHILFSAKRDDRRLIGVLMGAETAGGRNDDALKLLGYGFKNFAVRTLIREGESVGEVEAPNGDPPELSLVAAKSLIVTVRKGMEESIPLRKEIPSSVNPPISQGGVVGKLVLEGEGFPAEEIDLVAAHDVRFKSYAAYYLIVLAVVGGLFGFFLWRRQGFKKRTRR